MVSAVRVVVEPDPTIWFVGPTDDRPPSSWLPEAITLVEQLLEVDTDSEQQRRGVAMMLERIGQEYDKDSALRYQLIRWHSLQEVPFVVSYGLVGRDGQQTQLKDFVAFRGVPGVAESPVIETIDSDESQVRRSVAYIDDGALTVGVRYVVDTGDPDAVVLIEAGSPDVRFVIALMDDIDGFAREIRLTSED